MRFSKFYLDVADGHTLERGLTVLWDNLKSLDLWLLGWRGSLVGALILVMAGWRSNITPLLLGGILILPMGYVFFWYEGIQQAGPVYYFELLPFLMVGAGMGVTTILNRLDRGERLSRVISVGVIALLILGAIPHTYKSIQSLSSKYEEHRKLHKVLDNTPPKSIVFLPHWPQQLLFMLNENGLDSDPLVIKRHPDEWLGLVKLFPDRTFYRLRRGDPPHLIKLKPSKPFAVELPTGNFRYDTGVLHNEGNGEQIMARAGEHAPGVIGYGALTWLYPGWFKITYRGMTSRPGEYGETGVNVDLVEYGTEKIIAIEKISNAPPQQPLEFCVNNVGEPVLIEPRVYFTGLADVTFAGLRIEEAQIDCQ